jgi:hypothetical protein
MPSQPIARRLLLGAVRGNPGKLSEALPNVAVVVNEVTGNWSLTGHLGRRAARRSWPELRALVSAQAPWLSAPQPGRPGLCIVCRGPSGRRQQCFQCELHEQCAGGRLADLVLPVAYAVKAGPHARNLWQYKSDSCDQAAAAGAAFLLLALILVFLRDHGTCARRRVGEPTHVAVVPSARGRPGEHPLRTLIAPYLTWPWVSLSARPDQRQRDLDPDRFSAGPVPGGRVLLIDDTWTTGASAQSAAMALRRAGARTVATIVVGRHIGPDQAALLDFGPASMPFTTKLCAAHHTEPVAN